MLKIRKRFLLILLIVLIALIILPYLIPLSKSTTLPMPFENSRQFSVESTTIHYRLHEPTSELYLGKILLVHGLGGSTYSYEKNAPALADAGYLVVSVDLPGFGYSSRNTEEDHSQLHRAELLWQLLDELDQGQLNDVTEHDEVTAPAEVIVPTEITNSSWHLAGHSMGGGTVAAMAYQRPTSTASLILIDGALFESGRSNRFATFPILSRWVQVLLEHFIIKPRRFESFLESAYVQAPKAEDIEGYYEPLSLPGTARSALSLLKTAENITSEQLTQLTMPILAIWGEKDSWVPIEEAKRIQGLLPQTLLQIIPQSGHCPMETHPEEFNQHLLEWLNRN